MSHAVNQFLQLVRRTPPRPAAGAITLQRVCARCRRITAQRSTLDGDWETLLCLVCGQTQSYRVR